MKKTEDKNALKHLFGPAHLQRMASSLKLADPKLAHKKYADLLPALEPLAMKARVRLLRDELHKILPEDYPKALSILGKAMKSGKLEGFDLWPVTEFIQTYGLDHLDISLLALKEATKIFTSEWAIRPFLKTHPQKTFRFLLLCAKDKNTSVRRWASEGTRPRLPWGERLRDSIKDPSPAFPILETLKFDEELFVRKSIANHLNDIAKDHPAIVVGLLQKWQKDAGDKQAKKIDWIIRHSLRTLIKDGHTDALALIGIAKKLEMKAGTLKLKKNKIRMGERVEFSLSLQSLARKPQKLVVDYRIHFARANKKSSVKVFKGKNLSLAAGEEWRLEKSHHFKEITTREYYNGKHLLEIQVNGQVVAQAEFILSGAI